MALGSILDFLKRGPQPEAERETFARDESEHTLGIEPLRILVSPLTGDLQGLAARHIRDRLSGHSGVVISVADRPLTAPGADHSEPLFVSMAVDLGRRWLKRERAVAKVKKNARMAA